MLEQLLEWDSTLFIYLNGLGVEKFDIFWTTVTEITSWIPLFLFFGYLLYATFSTREATYRLLTLLLLVVFITTLTHWVKLGIARPRPNNELALNTVIRVLKSPTDFSFFSGHASSSFAITTLIYLFLRHHRKWVVIFFIWPVLFSLSRIFVGVHYPIDIISGAVVGLLSGALFFTLYRRFKQPDSTLGHP
ncbi:MAG: phosphatase PAP2 family protein [Bacteroidota bacterium]